MLIHGNVSSSVFFDELLEVMAPNFWTLAPDLRGFGDTQILPVDAHRGVADFSDDLHELIGALGLTGRPIHMLGWSLGGGVALQYLIDHPEQVASMTLMAPIAPYGFGGTRDLDGRPCYEDFAGSGGGVANAEFVERLGDEDRGDSSAVSPRNVMNQFYFKPPFTVELERENAFVESMLRTATGSANYPGDSQPSPNWPGVGPGETGVLNAISPRYFDLSGLIEVDPKPPILWIRGTDDQIVSDTSLFDMGYLGKLGAVPGWPGEDVFPPQPMIGQTRRLLEKYAEAGGSFEEEVIDDCAHAPHIERPEPFLEAFSRFLRRHG